MIEKKCDELLPMIQNCISNLEWFKMRIAFIALPKSWHNGKVKAMNTVGGKKTPLTML